MTEGADNSAPRQRRRRRLILRIALILALVAVIEPAALQRYRSPTASDCSQYTSP
jgi:hypothetical protein